MKKVGKEFKKTLSAILVAAMVFTSLPQTTLVANAEEEDQQYDVGDYGEVGAPDSETVVNPKYIVKDTNGDAVSDANVSAIVETDGDYFYVSGITADESCEIVSVGGTTQTTIDEFVGYKFPAPADGETIDVVVNKTYSVSVPASVSGATVKYYVNGASEATDPDAETNKIMDLAKGSTVKAVVTVTEEAADSTTVKYQLTNASGLEKDITSTRTKATAENTYEYTFTLTVNKDTTIHAITVTKATKQDVTFDLTAATGVTEIKYANKSDAAASDYKSVSLTDKKVSLAPDTYYFMITDAKTIKVQTGDPAGPVVYPTNVTAGTAYKVEVTAAPVKVTVTEEAEESTVNVSKDDNVKAVYYTTDSSVTSDSTQNVTKYAKAGTTIKVVKDAPVYVYVEYKDNYEKKSVKINGATEEATETNGVYTVTTNGVTSPAIVIESKQKTFDYTINAASSNAKIVVDSANITKVMVGSEDETDHYKSNNIVVATSGIQVDGQDVTDAVTNVVLTVLAGETLSFTVTPADGYKAPVAITTSDSKKVSQTDGTFSLKSSQTDTINVTTSAYADNTITFNADSDAQTPDEAYTIASQVKGITVLGKTEAENVKKANGETYAAKEKSAVSFKVEAQPGYEVKKVEYIYTPDGATSEKKVELTASNEAYTIESVPAVATSEVKIYTQIKAADANKVTFTFSDEAAVTLTTLTIGNAYQFENAYPVKSGTAVLTTANTVNYTITAKSGYEITEINSVKLQAASSSTSGSVSFTADKKEDTIVVTTAPKANTKDKFVKIAENDAYTFTLSDAEAVKTDAATASTPKKTTYKIDKDTAEVPFTITVPYGTKVTDIQISSASIIGGAAKIDLDKAVTSGKTVTYTGKLVTNLLTAETEANATEISVETADKTAVVKFFGLNPTDVYKNGASYALTSVGTNNDIQLGSVILFTVQDGYKLYTVDKEGKNPKAVTLDAYNKYKFTVTDDIYFSITDDVKAASYTVSAEYVKTDANGEQEGPFTLTDVSNTNTFVTPNDAEKVTVTLDTVTGHTLTIKEVASDSQKTTAKKVDGQTMKAEVAISKEDANKKVTVKLTVEDKTDATGAVKTVEIPVVFAIDATLTGIEVDGIANGGTITFDPATSKYFDAKVAPSTFKTEGKTIAQLTDVKVSVEKGTAATKANFVGNKLLITTGVKDETATITVTERGNSKNVLFKATVVTAVPAYNLAKAVSPSQSFNHVNITLTPDKNVKIAKDSILADKKIFYEVVVNATGDTVPTGSLANKAYYFAVPFDGDGNANPVSAAIAVNTAKTDAAAGTYELTSRIVVVSSSVTDVTQSDVETVIATSKAVTPVADSAIVSAGKAITLKVATRNAYYEDKLALTKKNTSVFNDGDEKVMAVVKYSKNGSYLGRVEGYVLNASGQRNYDFTVTANQTTGEVSVKTSATIGTVAPGKYTLVVLATGTDETKEQALYRASASMNFTVNQSITGITETDKKVKANPKKDTTLTLSPVLSGDTHYIGGKDKYIANKSKALKYELVTTGYTSTEAVKNVKANVVVNEKTGKITIKKGFVVGNDAKDNQFGVKITPNDFANNAGRALTIKVEVTNENIELGEVYLEKAGKKVTDATINMSDATGLSVHAFDKDGVDVSSFVTFKSSSGSAKVNAKNGWITVTKPAKNVTFTVTTTDGGKKTLKSAKYTFVYDKPQNLTLKFANCDETRDSGVYNTLVRVGENAYEYFGTVNSLFNYSVVDIQTDENGVETPVGVKKDIYSYKMSIKGGKLDQRTNEAGEAIGTVIPTAETTVITLKDNTNKTTKTITIKNTNFQTTKAPSAKLVDGKLFNNSQWTPLTFSVSGKVAYDYVYVTWESGNNAYVVPGAKKIEDGKFTLSAYGYKAGTDKYTLVYGTLASDGTTFLPETKATSLSVKVNKLADFKPQTTYTYNPYDCKYIELTGKPNNVDVDYSNLRNANIKGQPNKFLDYFTLETDTYTNDEGQQVTYYTGRLMPTAKLTEKAMTDGINANDLTGYVAYSYTNPKGAWVTKDAKITIKIETVNKVYTTDTVQMLNAANSVGLGLVSFEGKAIPVGKIQAKDATNWKVEALAPVKTDAKGNVTKNIKITALKAQTAGVQNVEFYVLPADSQYADKDVKNYGTLVTIPVEVLDAATFTGKVVGTDAIDLADKAVAETAFGTKLGAYWTANAEPGKNFEYTVEGVSIATAKLAENAPEGITLALNADKSMTLTVAKNKVALGSVVSVPVDLTFADKSAAETITIDVLVPAEIQTMADVKAMIEEELNVTAYNGSYNEASIQAKLDANVKPNIDPISCVEYTVSKVESVKETVNNAETEVTKKVTVTLTDKMDKTVTDTVVVELPKTVAKVQLTADDVYEGIAEYAGYIMPESEYKTLSEKQNKTEAEQKKLDNALVVTNSTTRFDIRAQLQKGIENDNFMLSIVTYSKTNATDKQGAAGNGSISVTYRLVTKNWRDNTTKSINKTIDSLYVAPTAP